MLPSQLLIESRECGLCIDSLLPLLLLLLLLWCALPNPFGTGTEDDQVRSGGEDDMIAVGDNDIGMAEEDVGG